MFQQFSFLGFYHYSLSIKRYSFLLLIFDIYLQYLNLFVHSYIYLLIEDLSVDFRLVVMLCDYSMITDWILSCPFMLRYFRHFTQSRIILIQSGSILIRSGLILIQWRLWNPILVRFVENFLQLFVYISDLKFTAYTRCWIYYLEF